MIVRPSRVPSAAIEIPRSNILEDLTSAGGVHQGTNTMALNLLQMVVRQGTNMLVVFKFDMAVSLIQVCRRYGFAPDARAFFVPNGSQPMKMGLQAWHGYFQYIISSRLLSRS